MEIGMDSFYTVPCEKRILCIGNWSLSDISYGLLLTEMLTEALQCRPLHYLDLFFNKIVSYILF